MSKISRQTNILYAGSSEIDITPLKEVQLTGSVGQRRFSEKTLDPLMAKVLVVSDTLKKICIISLDLTLIKSADAIKERLKTLGFAEDAVMVHVTQTHTAPSIGHIMLDESIEIPSEYEWIKGSESWYDTFVADQVEKCVGEAENKICPVKIFQGRGIEGRIAFNRRAVTVNGEIYMPGPARTWTDPLGPAALSHLEGPIDPEVGLLAFRSFSGASIALLLHFTCHPVCVFPKKYISADWPGAWCREIKKSVSAGCIPLVINGCCGNINPWNPFDPEYQDDYEQMGRILAGTADNILNSGRLEECRDTTLDWRSGILKLPYRKIDPAALMNAEEYLRKNPEIQWLDENRTEVKPEWFKAVNLIGLAAEIKRQKSFNYQVQVFRIGNCALVGLPGEPFVEGQLLIKGKSPAKRTLVAHCVNQYAGYIPIKNAFQYPAGRRGHEVNTCSWSKLDAGALEQITEQAISMLEEMFED
ncbi:MAG: hypothetical protein PHV59_04645 [Victivallales bacterium]|nr:hypothetical protein [Victivallales bacterium]